MKSNATTTTATTASVSVLSSLLFGLALAAWPAAAPAQQTAAANAAPEVPEEAIVVVEMQDFRFSPSRIEVQRGQIVRFVQVSQSPHNVEFRNVPMGTELGPANPSTVSGSSIRVGGGPPPAIGPFLMGEGSSYEVVIDESFATGIHEFVCTPHEAMGMTGVLVVTDGAASAPAVDNR